ncbi:MAG: hypothetical protein AB9M53_09820 [Leptothrix sp. (in: b-proteobacteria)]
MKTLQAFRAELPAGKRHAAVPADRDELLTLIGEAYQVLGVLAVECGRFDDPQVVKLLDNLAEERRVHADVLPFPSTPAA